MVETTQANIQLRALFEHYTITECWCGYGGDEVVSSFVARPSDPEASVAIYLEQPNLPEFAQQVEYLRTTFATLPKVCTLSASERRAGLIAEVADIFKTCGDEASRREAISRLGGAELLDSSEFWQDSGDEVPMATRSSDFLRFIEKTAKNSAGV